MYLESRLKGVGPLIQQLRHLELDVYEADELADKLAALGWIQAEIDQDDRKQRTDEAERPKRTRGQ